MRNRAKSTSKKKKKREVNKRQEEEKLSDKEINGTYIYKNAKILKKKIKLEDSLSKNNARRKKKTIEKEASLILYL